MRHTVRLIVLAPVIAALAACGPDPAALLARARQEAAARDDRAARIDLTEVLKARPADTEALLLLAQVQLRLGDGEGAVATLARFSAAGGHSPELGRMRASAELQRGEPDAAAAALAGDASAAAWRLRAAIALARKDDAAALAAFQAGLKAAGARPDKDLLLDYGRYLITAEDFPGAAQMLARLQSFAGDDYDVALFEGDLAARRRDFPVATRAYARAAGLAPRRIEPLLGQAEAADAAGRTDAAARFVAAAVALAPDDPRVIRWNIQLAQMRGDWESVRSQLASREGSLDPRSAEGLAYAEALLNLGQPEQARALFQRALSLSPQNPYARLMLAQAQLATGDGRAAFATVRPLAEAPDADARELTLAEQAARRAGLPEAAAFARRRASPGADAGHRLAEQGQAAYARGDWAGAVAAYTALQAQGENAEVLRRLALAASGAGQHDLAIRSADRALALDGSNADMLYAAGIVRLKAGRDPDRAAALLQSASAADPDNALFRTALARAGKPPRG